MTRPKIALIDADPLIYSCGFAVQKTVYEVVEETEHGSRVVNTYPERPPSQEGYVIIPCVVSEPVENALHIFKEAIYNILGATGAADYKLYLTGKGNFREALATIRPYKGNRDPCHKPVHYQALRDYAVNTWGAEIVNGQEADDAIAIEHSTAKDVETIVCSVDKDFWQVPGWNYNPKKRVLRYIEEDEARHNFWLSVLTGDPTDNIVGVPGIGPKKGAKILEGCKSDYDYYRACLAEFEKAHAVEKVVDVSTHLRNSIRLLRETAYLLYLRRGIGEVWQPPEKG